MRKSCPKIAKASQYLLKKSVLYWSMEDSYSVDYLSNSSGVSSDAIDLETLLEQSPAAPISRHGT